MAKDRLVTAERREGGVALVRLDRPKVNALSSALLSQLEEVTANLVADLPGAVVLWGGERVFAAGADIAELAQMSGDAVGENFDRPLRSLAALPRAVIAAVNGYALGGGLELALACDFRVAGESARFGFPEILLGIFPGAGGTQRLPRLVGPARAKEIILSGRQLSAAEALGIGLVDRVVPDGEVLEAALGWGRELASGALVAQALAKRAVDDGLSLSLDEGLALERRLFAEVLATEDAKVGIGSFLEHGPGKATFSGR